MYGGRYELGGEGREGKGSEGLREGGRMLLGRGCDTKYSKIRSKSRSI